MHKLFYGALVQYRTSLVSAFAIRQLSAWLQRNSRLHRSDPNDWLNSAHSACDYIHPRLKEFPRQLDSHLLRNEYSTCARPTGKKNKWILANFPHKYKLKPWTKPATFNCLKGKQTEGRAHMKAAKRKEKNRDGKEERRGIITSICTLHVNAAACRGSASRFCWRTGQMKDMQRRLDWLVPPPLTITNDKKQPR